MTEPSTFVARPKPRFLLTSGLFLLGAVAAVTALAWVSLLLTPTTSLRTAEDKYLAALPYPDPQPGHADLLILTRGRAHVTVSTHWLPLTSGPDGGGEGGAVYLRFETVIDGSSRLHPVDHVRLHLAATGDARLPTVFDTPLTLETERRLITLTTGPGLRAEAARNPPPPPLHDAMLYHLHPDAILDLLAPHGTPPTLTIGDHHAELTETHLAPLRAFAATLKPGYTPP